jgi:hypothetical protein
LERDRDRDRDRLGGVMTQKIKIDRYDFVIVLAVATFVVAERKGFEPLIRL